MIMIIMCIIHGDISCHLDEVKEPWRDSIAQGTAGLDFRRADVDYVDMRDSNILGTLNTWYDIKMPASAWGQVLDDQKSKLALHVLNFCKT